MGDVDAVQQHGELRGLQLGAEGALVEDGEAEAALLQAFVEDDEAAVVPGEDFHPVAAAGDEDEEVAGVDVFAPAAADEGGEAVDAVAQVDGLGGQEDADGAGEEQHAVIPARPPTRRRTRCRCPPRRAAPARAVAR